MMAAAGDARPLQKVSRRPCTEISMKMEKNLLSNPKIIYLHCASFRRHRRRRPRVMRRRMRQ